jgi:tripartite-type tricarboxylate transporter receptor subunit TctC
MKANVSRRRFLSFAAGLTVPVFVQSASAQNYPTRTVRIIVPLTAGSASDIYARQVATKLAESWGQPVIVENRAGAGTTLGTDAVAKAPPDGHTVLLTSAAFAASAAIYEKLPYDPLKDFAPVSQIAFGPIVVVAAPSLGARSIVDLIEIAKKRPDGVNFGTSGVGSSTHFAAEQFKLAAGFNATHVPYKGPGEALLDTVTGRIQISFSPILAAVPFVKDGRLIALGVTTRERSPVLAEAPTIAEAGLSGFDYQDWWGMFAPATTTPAIVEKINQGVVGFLGLPEVTKQLLVQGVEARSSQPEEFAKFVRSKIEAARQVAKAAGIRAG